MQMVEKRLMVDPLDDTGSVAFPSGGTAAAEDFCQTEFSPIEMKNAVNGPERDRGDTLVCS